MDQEWSKEQIAEIRKALWAIVSVLNSLWMVVFFGFLILVIVSVAKN